jgi:ribosomal protein L21E
MLERPCDYVGEMTRSSILNQLLEQSAPEPIAVDFKVGDRVQLSRRGRLRSPKFGESLGTVIGMTRNSRSVRVLFDDRKTSVALHFSYLQIAAGMANKDFE